MRVEPSTLDRFWLRMAGMFGHSWTSQYGAAPDGIGGDTWSAALGGLTTQHIALGLTALSRIPADWPPTAPKFRSLCLGIPSLAEARVMMRAGLADPAPFARLLWSYLDGYRYRQSPADVADRMLREAYELAVAFVMEGGAMPAPAEKIAQEAPQPEPAADAPPAIDSIADIQRRLYADAQPRTVQDELADLERASDDDFRRDE